MDKRLLIIDDEPDILRITIFRLEKRGFTVLSETTGEEGMECIRKEKPDLVLLDCQLPDKSGFEICQQIKLDNILKSIPVVMFTAGNIDQDFMARIEEVQADDYLIKPFEPENLFEKINKWLDSNH